MQITTNTTVRTSNDASTLTKFVTQGSVTTTFTEPVLSRRLADGSWAVQHPATIQSQTPAKTGTTAETLRNGMMVNPLWEGDDNAPNFEEGRQAWDGREGTVDSGGTSNANYSLEASSFPLTLNINGISIKGVSKLDETSDRSGWLSSSAAIYCVEDINALPAGDLASPCPMSWTGRTGLQFEPLNIDNFLSSIQTYDVTNHPSRTPYSTLAATLNRFQGMAAFSTSLSGDGYQAFLMNKTGENGNYGQGIIKIQEQMLLGILGNEWTYAQKREAVIFMASTGIHLLQLGSGDSSYFGKMPRGLGGHMQWQQPYVDIAEKCALGLNTSNLQQKVVSNMLLQAFQWTQPMLNEQEPHTDIFKTGFKTTDYLQRSVVATDTSDSLAHTVSVEWSQTNLRDIKRWQRDSMKVLTATDGSVRTNVRNIGTTQALEPPQEGPLVVPVEDATGFDGKTTYFDTTIPWQLGEFAWQGANITQSFDPRIASRVTYMGNNNRWAGWAIAAVAFGVADTQRLPAIRWTEQQVLGYRKMPTEPFESGWAKEFWAEHYDAIFSASSIGKGQFANVPFPFDNDDWYVVAGLSSAEIDINILSEPYDNEGAIIGVEYEVDSSGSWVSIPNYTGPGTYTISVPLSETSYDIALRAKNAIGYNYVKPDKNSLSGPLPIATNFPVPQDVATTAEDLVTTHEVALPSNLQEGNLITIEAFVVTVQPQAPTISGYALVESDGDRLFLFQKTAGASEPLTVTVNLATAGRASYIARRFTNWSEVKGISGIDGILNTRELVDQEGQNKNLWVSVAAASTSDWDVTAAPQGFTGLASQKAGESSSSASRGTLMSAYKTDQTGTVNPGQFTSGYTGDVSLGITYVVRPSA